MINEEKTNVKVYVINSNTGHIVRSETLLTNEELITIAVRYITKDSIVITTVSNFYCFCFIDGAYFCAVPDDILIIDFFKEVLSGLYDNARDSFHIEYGRVATLWQPINDENISKYTTLLKCIDDIWETRYYSRFLRRGKHD